MNKNLEIPAIHRNFIEISVEKLMDDQRIVGVAAGGSFVLKTMDEFSDLDLVLFIQQKDYQQVLEERKSIVEKVGPLLQAFTGEHVGEPRLLICLFGPPLLHVDFKFVSLDDIQNRVENPQILWERDNEISKKLAKTESNFPGPDLDWIENRFWIWIHYITQRIARGELFEVIDALSFLRGNVLGPMILQEAGARPQGVRRIEKYGLNYLENLKRTIPAYNRISCLSSLEKSIEIYRNLRNKLGYNPTKGLHTKVESEAMKYLVEIKSMILTE